MINPCYVVGKGFNVFDYDLRTNGLNGFTHEVASGHATTKRGRSVSAIHGSTIIIADHEDTFFNLYVGDFSITTGMFSKLFVSSNDLMTDMNYIEGTVLIIATPIYTPFNLEIHDTS
jgi:hypothetical protein